MTEEKIILILFMLILFIFALTIYKRSSESKKSRIFSASLGSILLGTVSFCTVWLLKFLTGKLISVNLCTLAIAAFASLPGVATMLILKII